MVIGPTGTGKTTLLNSYINYLMKIKYNDDFRYKIINENFNRGQSESQTKEVTNYNIKTPEGKLYQIIDTPGFGDTVGIEEDEKITMKITDFFLHRLNEINAVCLVIKSSDNRLTACQKYIFNCVFDLFGEDTKDIFIAMLTFCDGGKPQALASLLDKSCLFSKMIKNKNNDWYFKFNNSAIFEKDVEDVLNLTYWNIGMDSFHKFTEKLNTLPKVTLDQTKTVLNERSRLTKNVEILSKKLKDGLNKAETIKGYFKMISELKGNLNDSRNYTKVIKVPKSKKVPVTEKRRYMTTCLICNKTCHVGCYIKDDDDKSGYACIKDNHCVVCKNKCHWNEHKNRPYELVDYMDDETITLNDLKNKYYNSKNQLDAKTQILMGAKNDLIKLNLECMQTQQEMMNSVNRLKEIALNKTVFESVEEHIDELIINEKNEHKEGWQNRVQGLQVMKEQKKKLREISQGKNEDFDQIKKVIEDSISNEEDLKNFIKSMNDGTVKGDKCFIF
jgi:GTP-binding protein EngB required for normal cell division